MRMPFQTHPFDTDGMDFDTPAPLPADVGTASGDAAIMASAASGGFTASASLASAEPEIAFVSGDGSNGAPAATSYWTDNGQTAHKWGIGSSNNSTAGTSGGTVTYTFASSFTATEIATWKECFALWSAVCNIQFTEAASGGQVQLVRGTDGGAHTSDTATRAGTTRMGRVTASTISIDTSVGGFDLSGSFTSYSGYGLGTVVHEMGHMLGLGHAGDYSGNVDPATQQLGAFDSRLWSIMSYIQPSDSSAAYFGSYPVTGTNWGGAQTSTTWMPLDIAAAQRIYGAATGGPLSGGQVFGFNCNVAASISSFFDFTINAAPVITLYDSGTGNTLDLSGYSTAETIDLRAGDFSSFAGLVNNMGIAFGTRIDAAIGGTGSNVFYTNGDGDTITGHGGDNSVHFANSYASYSLVITGAYSAKVSAGAEVNILSGVQNLVFSDQTIGIACFVAGTRIATPAGDCAVEALAIGDLVSTAGGIARPVKWIGRRSYTASEIAANPHLHPVVFARDAVAGGQPRRALSLSPMHAILVDGMLVPAASLVNGATIRRADTASAVDYIHVELEDHDLVLAEGLAAETFLDDASRLMFDNADEYYEIYGGDPVSGGFCAPRLEEGYHLEAIRRRLAKIEHAAPGALLGHVERLERGVLHGWAMDAASPGAPVEFDVLVDNIPVARILANRYRSDLDHAGLAGGRCGFALPLDGVELARIALIRRGDGARLPVLADAGQWTDRPRITI